MQCNRGLFPFRATLSIKWTNLRMNKELVWSDRLGVEDYEEQVPWESFDIDAKRVKWKHLAHVIRLAILRHFRKWNKKVNKKKVKSFSNVVAKGFRDLAQLSNFSITIAKGFRSIDRNAEINDDDWPEKAMVMSLRK